MPSQHTDSTFTQTLPICVCICYRLLLPAAMPFSAWHLQPSTEWFESGLCSVAPPFTCTHTPTHTHTDTSTLTHTRLLVCPSPSSSAPCVFLSGQARPGGCSRRDQLSMVAWSLRSHLIGFLC